MELKIEKIDEVLEALLFVSGDSLKISDICEQLELQKSEVTAAVKRLQKKFGGKSGIHLLSFNGQLQLASNPDYADIIACVLNPIKEKALSTPAMETLSIIAYRQPVTRLEVEHIRGVNCDYALQALLKNNLIEIVGRKDTLGKPLLFGTTDVFLKRFAIEDLSQLPGRDELLEKIREIEESAPSEEEETLYNFADNAENPDFLEGEDVVMIEGDETVEGDPNSEAAATDGND
ncbi:MAG: SMC-Scp complex subunit ScpB [Clostridiales bacterium]|nr:SMC-Scp complex subunit ScpB [Clostridiales bacterium]